MELIIKPTGRCNFDCSFCSADNLDIVHPEHGVPDKIKDLIAKLQPNSIIVTGGEPLTVDPSYYLELQEFAGVHVGFTTNMKDFYLHPDKWKEVFCNPNFGFITSFNYGDSRKWDPHTVYTEEMFRKVTDLFKEVTGRPSLPFIAVIDENNEDLIMDHVYLAKELGTQVKINPACKMGRQGTNYPKYKIIKKYIEIIDAGLGDYEITCSERKFGRCAFNTNLLCRSTIRVCYIDKAGELHYGCCEDLLSIGQEIPMDPEFPVKPVPVFPPKCNHLTNHCLSCELFRICHGCSAHLTHAHEFPEYCEEMLKMKDDLIRQGWAL